MRATLTDFRYFQARLTRASASAGGSRAPRVKRGVCPRSRASLALRGCRRIAGTVCVALLWAALMPGDVGAAEQSERIDFGGSRALDVTLWYPDDVAVIRGVVVFTGGQADGGSGDTRGRPDNALWRAFGESLGFGVLGTQFSGSYTDAAQGPGDALLDVLRALGDSTGHPELANVPLLLQGFSNGGYFSFTFSQYQPERVIAFCLNKSGFAEAPFDPAFLAVPGFLIWGSEEPPDVPTVIHSLVQQGRAQHALWAELREWDRAHEEGAVAEAYAPFFAEMVAARYPAGADPRAGVVPLLALDEASGWLGDHSDASVESDVPMIAAYAAYPGDKAEASWLPSEGLAKLWRGFVTRNPLALGAPSAAALIDASQPLELSVTGLPSVSEQVEFFDQAQALLSHPVSGGEVTSSWEPAWGGVRGIAAAALGASGEVLRVSQPVHVVLRGKDAPAASTEGMNTDAGVADGGVVGRQDAGGARDAAVGGQSGARATVGEGGAGGQSGVASGAGGRSASDKGSDPDAGLGSNLRKRDASEIHGGCACSLRGASDLRDARSTWATGAACAVLLWLGVARAARRRAARARLPR